MRLSTGGYQSFVMGYQPRADDIQLDERVAVVPHSCDHCRRFVLNPEFDKRGIPRVFFDVPLTELPEAGSQGCEFARWLLDLGWIHWTSLLDEDPPADRNWYYLWERRLLELGGDCLQPNLGERTLRSLLREDSGAPEGHTLVLGAVFDHQGGNQLDWLRCSCFFLYDPEAGHIVFRIRESLRIYADSLDLASRHISTRPIQLDPFGLFKQRYGWKACLGLCLDCWYHGTPIEEFGRDTSQLSGVARMIETTRQRLILAKNWLKYRVVVGIMTWIMKWIIDWIIPDPGDVVDSPHSHCPRPDPEFLPTRLVEVWAPKTEGEEPRLRLCMTNLEPSLEGEPVAYAALSYCWGGEQMFKLTRDTLPEWRSSLPWGKLPQTLKDAALACTKLGIPYLWIDALCILQDSPEDKAAEIAAMSKIYRNSTLTIAAAAATSVDEGFLAPRTLPDGGVAFMLPFVCAPVSEGGERPLGNVVLASRIDEAPDPIHTRGWTLQERLLSPRTLEVGRWQTYWLCQQNSVNDGWRKPRAPGWIDTGGLEPVNLQIDRLESTGFILGLDADTPEVEQDPFSAQYGRSREADTWWYRLVQVFTRRALTNPSDRLLAMSGIASRFAHLHKDQYVCGHWMTDLEDSLAWKVNIAAPLPRRAPGLYIAPSWSWASVNCAVTFPKWASMLLGEYDRPDAGDQTTASNWECEPESGSPKLIRVVLNLANPLQPFGAVKEGTHLVLRGPMLRIAPFVRRGRLVYFDTLEDQPRKGMCEVVLDEESPYDAMPETRETWWDSGSADDICLLECEKYSGLVLRGIGGGGVNRFARIGTFEFNTHLTRNGPGEEVWTKNMGYDLFDIVEPVFFDFY
ncbi:Heterokaryon incompatibility protein (HET) domain containing protein [Naviculisporaceae sp. PSN 640]